MNREIKHLSLNIYIYTYIHINGHQPPPPDHITPACACMCRVTRTLFFSLVHMSSVAETGMKEVEEGLLTGN